MPEQFYYLHLVSNLLSGLSFWGISFFFSIFINRVQLKILEEDQDKPLWIRINRYNFLFSVVSAVFFFCGLGHIVEAFTPWTNEYAYIMIIHCSTASLGVILIFLFYKSLFSND